MDFYISNQFLMIMTINYHLDKEEFRQNVEKWQKEHKRPIPFSEVGHMILGQKQFHNKCVAIPGEQNARMIQDAKDILKSMGYEERDKNYTLKDK